jgi:hypothetical protein
MQIDDTFTIGFRGKTYPIGERPLKQKFDHDYIRSILNSEMCSRSWRGYKANWQLIEGRLMLTSIQKNPCNEEYNTVSSSTFFESQKYPINADWFTGKITLMVGEVNYLHKNDVQIGYDQDVFVFYFAGGELVSKGMEVVNRRYDENRIKP